MKKIYGFFTILSVSYLQAQVGINTTNPQSTLDVNGNVIIRTVDSAATSSTYDFLVHNTVTKEIQKVNGNFNSTAPIKTISKGTEKNGITLLSGSLFAGWQKINFASDNIPINEGNHFDSEDDFYIVPSNGIYQIDYSFRYGSGVIASLLGNTKIGILKHVGSSYTVLDERKFSGVNLAALINLTISDTSINSVYKLSAGDKISFEINAGRISLRLLGSSSAAFVIRKISD